MERVGGERSDRPGDRPAVALLRPPVVVKPDGLATHGPTPPIGLAYVAAALRQAGHEVMVVDGAGEGIDRCAELDSPVGPLHRIGLSPIEIADRLPPGIRVVGITHMFLHEWPQVRELAREVRRRLPRAVIVVGGENATAFAPWILAECAEIDACVLGEGERTVVALVDRVLDGHPVDDLPGVATREPRPEVARLPTRIRRREVDGLARPAWDLIPLERYWSHEPFFGVHRGRPMQVLGTRGCPYRCTFCSSPQMWTTSFVVREPRDVVDEIADYVERYGVETVNFVDLTAATNRRWTLELCRELERRALGITWQLPVGTRIEGIDREVLEHMHAAGCRNLTFAPESGSPRMLRIMNKRASLDHVLESLADARAVGLLATVNIIVGHPEERWSDLLRSLGFLVRAAWTGASDTAVIMFCPYPGSVDFEHLVATGRHVMDEAALYVGLSRSSRSHQSWNPRMPSWSLRIAQLTMIGAFYVTAMVRRPSRALQAVGALFGGGERTYLDQMLRTRRTRIRPNGHAAETVADAVVPAEPEPLVLDAAS